MLDGRVGVRHARRLGLVVRQQVDVAAGERVGGPEVEVDRPAGRLGLDAELLEERQAVGEEARPDDQHALVAQRAQPLAELHQPVRVVGGQRHLQHRDVGLGVHDLQRHPRAVVEAAGGVLVDRLAVGHHRRDPLRQRAWRRASRRSSGSTSARTRRSRRPAARRLADRLTGADSQWALTMRIAFGRGRSRGPGRELAGPDRVVEQRRRTVADVEGRHRSGHDILNSSRFNYIPR